MTQAFDFARPDYWAALEWWPIVAALGVFLAVMLVWSWLRRGVPLWIRIVGAAAKTAAILLLMMMLLEPMRSESRPRPGANLFVILADDSRSLEVKDAGEDRSRAERMKAALEREAAWQVRLGQDFDTRRYVFDRRVRPVADFDELSAEGDGSALVSSLETVARRYKGRPQAGILLLSDGNATDLGEETIDFSKLPPVYPVVLGGEGAAKDISVTRISASQTNFEAAPVTVTAEIVCRGYAGGTIVTELLDESGQRLDVRLVKNVADDHPFALPFQIKPQSRGVLFYRVRAFAEGTEKQFERPAESKEATLANNSRLVMVDRGGGPFRVLYVTGRPNWELKFLRRAIEGDDEVNLVALIRIARKEPKFTFRSRDDDANPLFRGFGEDAEQAEQYDEPVLLRLGTEDEEELRGGFPQASDELFRYHAVVLDDVEADFFDQDQKSLLQQFVSRRGGGFLMLGGQETFVKGGYARTPIGEMLPVYVDRGFETAPAEKYQLVLTREGWLEPWVRVRSTEEEETRRLERMPPFATVNRVTSIKPGATVLSRVESARGEVHPALVVQPFGKGRSAALLVGDMWRWQLHRDAGEENDLEKAWRQTLRWLVADVPQRIEIDVKRRLNEPHQPVELHVTIHDEMYRPLDNASVGVTITTPEGKSIELTAEPAEGTQGQYVVTFVPRTPGAYRAEVSATAADASDIGSRQAGWVAEPAAEEFKSLSPNRKLLDRIARESGGEVIELDGLDGFVRGLPNRKIPVTDPHVYPMWHTWVMFCVAVGLFVSEWGLRRWKGLP